MAGKLIYDVAFNSQTRALSFSDRAGNNIYSCTIPASHPLTFVSTEDGSTIWLFERFVPTSFVQYEVDTGNGWTSYSTYDKPHLTLNRGESCRWRCSNRKGVQTSNSYVNFGMTGSFEAYGNIHSMLVSNFENITSLADYPYAFYNLFKNCTSLKKAPVLPATTLSEGCYRGLFDGAGIVYPPKLPATTLANSCYRSLFANSASLTQCADLPATTLVQDCYRFLYYNAPLIAEAKIAANTTASDALSDWLYGSASVGNIYCDPTLGYPEGGSGIPKGWERWVYGATDTGTTTTMYHNGVAETIMVGTSAYGVCYSVQGWVGFKALDQMHKAGFTFGAQTAVTMYNYDEQITAYSCAANVDDGFTETMYDTGSGKGYLDISSQNDDGFYFESTPWTGLTLTATADNSSVSLTKIGSSTSNLRSTFEVNMGHGWNAYAYRTGINLNDGESCKFRCSYYDSTTNYQRRPQFVMTGTIEASGNCYSMLSKSFESITDLNNDGNGFYLGHLFDGCTPLTKAPELPATTLTRECYYALFKNTGLTKAPLLPATDALIEGCYAEMFSGSGSLKEVRIAATTLASNALTNWLSNVAATGDFYCDPNATIVADSPSGIPQNWVRRNINDYPTT